MTSQAPPPSYVEASADARPVPTPRRNDSAIPAEERRSMEDIHRPLPDGWIRQWDPTSHHHFYVDTRATPTRSTWHHPLDDGVGHEGAHAGELDETTDEEGGGRGAGAAPAKAPPTGIKKLGQQVKNSLSNSTHEERVAKRKERRAVEERAYEQHRAIRAALVRASQTGQPQLVGRTQAGRDVYAQPPPRMDPYAGPQLGYAPYQTEQSYPYGPGAYAAPMGPYGRRRGYGYGGGMGLPVFGGLAGGMMLGGLMF